MTTNMTGPHGLEMLLEDFQAIRKVVDLIGLAAENADQMDIRILPGVWATAESAARQLTEACDGLEVLMSEWFADRRKEAGK
jgi:hypothetical protein